MTKAPRHESEETLELEDSERTPCEVWTRVMGYHRPVSEFNPGKQSEHRERRHFREARRRQASATGGAAADAGSEEPSAGNRHGAHGAG